MLSDAMLSKGVGASLLVEKWQAERWTMGSRLYYAMLMLVLMMFRQPVRSKWGLSIGQWTKGR